MQHDKASLLAGKMQHDSKFHNLLLLCGIRSFSKIIVFEKYHISHIICALQNLLTSKISQTSKLHNS